MGKYDHLLSPVMVGNHIFKNRLIMTPTTPQHFQDDEGYPAETLFAHYLKRAKNGAALVTLSGIYSYNDTDNPMPEEMRGHFRFDADRDENHYLSQLVEGIHGYGSYATIQIQHTFPKGWDICAGATPFGATMYEEVHTSAQEYTEEMMKDATDLLVKQCLNLKKIGFDGIFFHMSYQQTPLGRSLSPIINQRTDKYGGSFENRIRFLTETCDAIKGACGKDFIIEAHITGEERDLQGNYIPGGWTADDTVALAEAMSGKLDILHIRGWSVDMQHPTWITPDEPPYLDLAAKAKEAKTEVKILTTAGHKNPDMMEQVLADGKADLIGVARCLIADPQFIEKLYEDRADDIVPCLRCNKCFDWTAPTIRTNRCSVNPMWGFESRASYLIEPAHDCKKIAVAGGGPAGMKAAIVAKERGHEVVIYEKGAKLGGQLNIADHSQRKWALRDYRDYLIHQVEKLGIEVKLETALTTELANEGGYDVVIAAMGSRPKVPAIPGIDGENVFNVLNVYGQEEKLGKKVVIVGGGATAVETGMHLAEEFGREVTVLGRNALIAKDAPVTLYRFILENAWNAVENLTTVTNAAVNSIDGQGVTYVDADGNEQRVECDSVVISVGMEPMRDEAFELAGCNVRLMIIGDNRIPASILELTREAYLAATSL